MDNFANRDISHWYTTTLTDRVLAKANADVVDTDAEAVGGGDGASEEAVWEGRLRKRPRNRIDSLTNIAFQGVSKRKGKGKAKKGTKR